MPRLAASQPKTSQRAPTAGQPMLTLEEMLNDAPFMVLAPHPDDEVLGCGGLLALAADAGLPALVATLTDGSASHASSLWPPRRLAEQREREVHDGLALLGATDVMVVPLGLPDGGLGQPTVRASLLPTLGQLARRHKAHSLLVTDAGDDHPDHKEAFRLASALLAQGIVQRVFSFPVSQRLDGQDVSRFRRLRTSQLANRKRAAIEAHLSQTGKIADLGAGFCLSQEAINAFATEDEMFLLA